jgi:hypothetical protein
MLCDLAGEQEEGNLWTDGDRRGVAVLQHLFYKNFVETMGKLLLNGQVACASVDILSRQP